MKLKILSDTHQFHLDEPQTKVDLLIHCGDATNYREEYSNEKEWWYFWEWWLGYPAEYKVYVPGNHDSFLDSPAGRTFIKEVNSGVDKHIILINETVTIEGIKIFGSPYTPTFGNWSFMRDRGKIGKNWKHIEDDTDIVITHGPPKSILDLSFGGYSRTLEFCGDGSLLKRIMKVKPKYHFFGHIHGNRDFENNGTLIRNGINFVNCSQVKDGMFDEGLMYKGKEIEWETQLD